MTVAIGFFDGVHLGHQAILKGADVALTFKNHPLSYLAPERAPRLIMGWKERVKVIEQLGVRVIVLEFDAEIARLEPAAFLAWLNRQASAWTEQWRLSKEPLVIRAGANWRFGQGGLGDANFARAHGIEVTVVPYAVYQSKPISSTRIRTALAQGDVMSANAMLGRRLKVEGRVFKGKGAGMRLGFPTINMVDEDQTKVRMLGGVYEVVFQGKKAIANFGIAPTFAEKAWTNPVWEVHVIGEKKLESIEGMADFEVVRYIRPERKFALIEDLQRQIIADCGIICP